MQQQMQPFFKADKQATHDLLNDIQRAYVKSVAQFLLEHRAIKLTMAFVKQVIAEGITSRIWDAQFAPGDSGDMEKYICTRLKNEKKSLSKKSMLEESKSSINSFVASSLGTEEISDLLNDT